MLELSSHHFYSPSSGSSSFSRPYISYGDICSNTKARRELGPLAHVCCWPGLMGCAFSSVLGILSTAVCDTQASHILWLFILPTVIISNSVAQFSSCEHSLRSELPHYISLNARKYIRNLCGVVARIRLSIESSSELDPPNTSSVHASTVAHKQLPTSTRLCSGPRQ